VAKEISSLRMALERSLRDLGLQKRLKTEQLTVLWPQTVGPAVAKIAYPSQFRGGTLFIEVADSVWMQELKFQEGELIARLNDAMGEPLVRRLFFQLARTPPPELAPQSEVKAAPSELTLLDPQQELALEREVAGVRDPQLREVLKEFRRRLLQARPSSSA
jgi:predicted nucleic acid-binding Zn ribbon protein